MDSFRTFDRKRSLNGKYWWAVVVVVSLLLQES